MKGKLNVNLQFFGIFLPDWFQIKKEKIKNYNNKLVHQTS